jgi:hypothetical protein
MDPKAIESNNNTIDLFKNENESSIAPATESPLSAPRIIMNLTDDDNEYSVDSVEHEQQQVPQPAATQEFVFDPHQGFSNMCYSSSVASMLKDVQANEKKTTTGKYGSNKQPDLNVASFAVNSHGNLLNNAVIGSASEVANHQLQLPKSAGRVHALIKSEMNSTSQSSIDTRIKYSDEADLIPLILINGKFFSFDEQKKMRANATISLV